MLATIENKLLAELILLYISSFTVGAIGLLALAHIGDLMRKKDDDNQPPTATAPA